MRRVEVAPALVGVAVDQDVVGARDVRPEAAGRLPELLVDERPARARTSPGRRPRPGSEPPCSRASIAAAPDRVAPVARDAPAGPLELDLERLEDVAHERAGARLELELGRGEGQVHARKDAAPVGDAHAVAAAGRGAAGGRARTALSRAGRAP